MVPDPSDTLVQQTDAREAIQEVLRALRRNVVRVVFTTLVCLMIGFGLTMIWPAKFESNSVFVLRDTRVFSGAISSGNREDLSALSETKKLQALENELHSRKRIESVMRELQWPEWLETAGKESDRRDLAKKLAKNLTVTMVRDVTGAYIIGISFRWTSPRKTTDFVNRLRDLWIQLTIEGYNKSLEEESARAQAVLTGRDRDYRAAASALANYKDENNVSGLLSPEANQAIIVEQMNAEGRLMAELRTVLTKIESKQLEVQATEPTVLQPAPAPPGPPAEQLALVTRYRDTKKALATLKQTYTAEHLKVKKAQVEFETARKAMEDGGVDPAELEAQLLAPPPAPIPVQNEVYVTRLEELKQLRDREVEIRAELADVRAAQAVASAALRKLPEVELELGRLQAAVTSGEDLVALQKAVVQPLKEQLMRARSATFGSDSRGFEGSGGVFEILETAVEPEQPMLPIGAIIMAIGLVVGVLLGATGPILTEMTRSSFGTVKEVSRTLGVPVLGAVDLILTTRDVRARSVQQALTYTTMTIVLASLATALYIYKSHQYVLPATLLRMIRDVKMALT
jgi:capsular polysaccharide biosynthesis protein